MLHAWSRRLLGLVLSIVAVGAAAQVAQAQTGKLTGVVTDQATGQPLEGVQVFLQGTGYGTVTNATGRYFLLSVPPGTYTVAARRIGYGEQSRTNVQIQIDVTRELSFQLSSAATQVAAVRVEAEATPLVPTGQTGSSRILNAQDITQLPVTSIEGALALQQGFIQTPQTTTIESFAQSRRQATSPIHIRGGRQGETLLLIDGIPANNFIYGGPALSLSPLAVQQLSFEKGGMEPQYGNALSGVINIATKEGGADLAGALNYSTSRIGDALGNTPDQLRGYQLVEGFVSGPVPGTASRMTFMFSGREERQADAVYQYDQDIFDPSRMPTTEAMPPGAANFRDVFPGWRSFGYDNQRQAFAKLAFKFTGTMKLGVTFLDNENQRQPFDPQYLPTYGSVLNSPVATSMADSAVFIGNLTGYRLANLDFEKVVESSINANQRLYAANFEHTLSRTSYKVIGGIFRTRRQTCNYFQGVCLEDQFGDPNFTDDQFIGPLAGTCLIHPTCGTDVDFGGEKLDTYVLRGDVQSQVTDHHAVQGGFLYQRYDFSVNQSQNVGTNLVNIYRQSYSNTPYDWATYIQDRIEYDFLTLKLGARFDYGVVPGKFFADPLDPTNGTTAVDVCANPTDARWANGVHYTDFTDTGTPYDTVLTPNAAWATTGCSAEDTKLAGKIAASDDFRAAKARKQFSPRIGVSFPLTQRSQVFFNFGRYSQNPLLNNLLSNTGIGTPREGTVRGPVLDVPGEGGPGVIGNPNLTIERSTTYEMGYSGEFARNYAFGVTLFNKNQTGLTGIRLGGQRPGRYGYEQVFDPAVTYGSSNTPSYYILVNQDYQSVRGFETSLRRRVADYWGFDVNYSYSRARTNASDPEREFERVQSQGDPRNLTEVPSDIDLPHVFNASLIFQVQEQPPSIPLGWLLRNSLASVTVQTASGYPYTPVTDYYGSGNAKLFRNSGRGPSVSTIDALLRKGFNTANLRYDAFLQINNIFDRKNCVDVFASTGTCFAGAVDQTRSRQGNSVRPDIATSTYSDRADFFAGAGQPFGRRTLLGGIKVNF